MNHETAKALVEAWLSDPQNKLFAKFTISSYPATALISAIAAAPCDECGHVKEQNQRIRERLGWTEGDLLNTNIREVEALRARVAELKAALRNNLDPLEFWADLAEVLGHERPTKADVPALVSEVRTRLAAATPSPNDETTAREIALDKFGDAYTNDILLRRIAASLTASRNAVIDVIKAKAGRYFVLSQEMSLSEHDRKDFACREVAANELLSALRKEPQK